MLSLNETNTNQQQYQHRPTIMSDNPTADPPFVNATTDMKIYELWFRLPLNTNSEKIWTTDFAIPFKENITINLFFCLDDSGTGMSYALSRNGESRVTCGTQLYVSSAHLRQPFEKTYGTINRGFQNITAIGLDNVDPNTIEEGSQHRLFMAQLVIWACAPEESPSSDSSDSESDDDEVLPSKTVINPLLPRLLPSSSTAQVRHLPESTQRSGRATAPAALPRVIQGGPASPTAVELSPSPEAEPSPSPEAEPSLTNLTPSPPPLFPAPSRPPLFPALSLPPLFPAPSPPPLFPAPSLSPLFFAPSPPPLFPSSHTQISEEGSSSQASTTPSPPPHLVASSTIRVGRLSASTRRGGWMTRPVAPPRVPRIRPVSPIAEDPSLSSETEDSSSFPMEEDPSPPPEAEESSLSPEEEDPSPPPEAEESSSQASTTPSPPPLLAASSTIQVRRLSASIRRGGKMARPVAPPRLPRIRPVSPIADDPSPPPEAEESSSSPEEEDPSPPPEAEESSSSPEEEDPSPPPEAEESSSQASTTPSPPHLAASSTIQVRRLSASIQRGGRMTRPVAPPRLPQIRPVSPIAGDPSLSPDTEDSSSFPMEEDPSPPPEAEESSSSPMEEDPSPSPEAEDSSPSPEAETSPSNYVPSPPPLSPSPPPAVHPQNTQGTAPRRIMTRSRTLAARQAAVRNSEVFRYISLPTAWDLEEREKQRKAAKFRNEDLSTRLKGNERRGPPPSGAGGSSSIAARYMMLPTTILPDFYGVLGHSSLDTLEMVMSLNASAYNVDQGSATCTTVNKDRGKKRVSDDEDTGENGREQFNGTFFVNKRKRL